MLKASHRILCSLRTLAIALLIMLEEFIKVSGINVKLQLLKILASLLLSCKVLNNLGWPNVNSMLATL